MVDFIFNCHGYDFQCGVGIFRASFEAAMEALNAGAERAIREATDYEKSLEDGGEWIGEHDEDGYTIWAQSDVLSMKREAAEDAAMALRKALMIALYHHWERSARIWTDIQKGDHEKIARRVRDKGYPIHNKLDAVRWLANTLKHDSDESGTRLQELWPEVFGTNFKRKPEGTDWYGAVGVTDDHVGEALDIVSASGPTWQTI